MTINIPLLRTIFPLLESCYGFKNQEIQNELLRVYDRQSQEGQLDKELHEKHSYEKGEHKYIKVIDYVLDTEDKVTITTTNNFNEKAEAVITLCKKNFEQGEEIYKNVVRTLVVMAAILNRNGNGLSPNEDIGEINWNIDTYALQVRPDLLRLYIARHREKNKYHKSCYIKFGYTAEAVEIQTMYPWFEKMLDRYLNKFLGVGDMDEAKKELQQIYGKKVGAKLNETAARFIWGTYHLLQTVPDMKSLKENSVTNAQSRFIHEYLGILELIDPIEIEPISIRGRLNNLLKKYSTVEEVLDERLYKSSPNNDNDWELF